MIVGLGDPDPVYYGPEELPGDRAPTGTVEIGPMTIRPAQSVARIYSPPAGKTSLVSKVMPVKLGGDGKARIWGLPPTVAYVLAAVILGGAGYLAYQRFSGGGRQLVAANSPRRRRRARRASRRKR